MLHYFCVLILACLQLLLFACDPDPWPVPWLSSSACGPNLGLPFTISCVLSGCFPSLPTERDLGDPGGRDLDPVAAKAILTTRGSGEYQLDLRLRALWESWAHVSCPSAAVRYWVHYLVVHPCLTGGNLSPGHR